MKIATVICRIGSLEIFAWMRENGFLVICRIGSLEIALVLVFVFHVVICRIGSLEMHGRAYVRPPKSYLPYRQLRKHRSCWRKRTSALSAV